MLNLKGHRIPAFPGEIDENVVSRQFVDNDEYFRLITPLPDNVRGKAEVVDHKTSVKRSRPGKAEAVTDADHKISVKGSGPSTKESTARKPNKRPAKKTTKQDPKKEPKKKPKSDGLLGAEAGSGLRRSSR